MPIYKKKTHGKSHLYGRIDNKEEYIGPEDNPQKWNYGILKKVLKVEEEKINESLTRYIDDTLLLSLGIPEPERKEYLSKRTTELLGRLRRIGEEIQDEQWDLIESVAALAMKSSDRKTIDQISKEVRRRLEKNAKS